MPRPVLAVDAKGTVHLTYYQGDAVAWQVIDKAGHPTAERGHVEGLLAWSLVTAFARLDGGSRWYIERAGPENRTISSVRPHQLSVGPNLFDLSARSGSHCFWFSGQQFGQGNSSPVSGQV
jgi:hypothetical protein